MNLSTKQNQSNFKLYIFIWVAAAIFVSVVNLLLPIKFTGASLCILLIFIGAIANNRILIFISTILGISFIGISYFLYYPSEINYQFINSSLISLFILVFSSYFCLFRNKVKLNFSKRNREIDKLFQNHSDQLNKTNELLKQETAYVQLHKDIAVASNENRAIEDTLKYCLKRICDHAQWPVGHLYLVENFNIVSSTIWYLEDHHQFERFRVISEATAFTPGIGLPGRVLEQGKPAWIIDVTQDPNFPRAQQAQNLGVKAGFAFPILIGSEVAGVMEFFSTEAAEPKNEMLEIMGHVGAQLGRVLERQRAEKEQSQLLQNLKQKVNELTCFYNVANLIANSTTIHDVFRNLETHVIKAFHYPNHTHIKITFDDDFFISPGFKDSKSKLEAPLIINEQHSGKLEAFYSGPLANNDVKLFTEEEQNLLEGIAHLLSMATQKKIAEEETFRSRQQLRNLYHRLENVREEERTRIAREIHDELAQVLTTLKLDLSLLSKKLEVEIPSLRNDTNRILNLIDQTIPSVKKLILDLRPPMLDDLGLREAIQWQGSEFEKKTGIECNIYFDDEDFHLDNDRSTTIFRIFQETLTNVVRHSKAKNLDVFLNQKEDTINLIVKDDGIGIPIENISNGKSLGLLGMRERASVWGGTVDILGEPNNGTTVNIKINRS